MPSLWVAPQSHGGVHFGAKLCYWSRIRPVKARGVSAPPPVRWFFFDSLEDLVQ